MKAANISVESLFNPIGINKDDVRITWNVSGGVRQKAYRIYGSINDESFDTSFIESSNMYYDFAFPLFEKDEVKFSVELKDENGLVEKDSSSYFFEIGIDGFKTSKFISGNYTVNKNRRYPADHFRKTFDVKDVIKARLYSSAHGIYYVSINGMRVSNDIFNPGFTDYNKHLKISTFDVTDLIKNGENEITVELGDGWYRGSIGSKGRTNTYGTVTKIIGELHLEFKDGSKTIIPTDKSWDWSNDGEVLFGDLKDGEIVDLNKKPTYSNKAKEINTKTNFSNLNTNPVVENETFIPEKTYRLESSTIFEFNQNLSGYFYIKCNKKTEEKIKVVMGEMLDSDGHVSLSNIQCVRKGKKTPLQECTIILKDGANEYKPKFYFGGFKYIEVFGDAEIVKINQIALYSKIKEVSSFECSNELINKFYKNTLWSLKSNIIDIPTDCPTRERMGWTGDSQVFFNTACYLTDFKSFSKKHVMDIFDRQWKNGKTSHIVPFSNEDWFMNPMNGSVGWADACVLIPYRYYLMYNDDRLLKKYFNNILNYAHFMIKRCGREKGIYSLYAKPLHLSKENKKYQVNTGQSYGEWAEPNDVKPFVWTDFCEPHPEESMAYTSYILNLVLEIEDILSRDDDRKLLTKYRDGVKKAYQELVTKENFSLDTDRQCKLVRPLYMHLLNSEQEKFARKRLVKALENYGYRLGTGFLSTPFILDVLKDIDPKLSMKLLLNEEMPGWLYMAKHDTGTIWEGWEGPNSQVGIASLNHYSKGAMVEWLFRGLLGINIRPNNEIVIEPLFVDELKYYRGSYKSVYGEVKVSVEGNAIEIEVPSNTNSIFINKGTHYNLVPGKNTFNI